MGWVLASSSTRGANSSCKHSKKPHQPSKIFPELFLTELIHQTWCARQSKQFLWGSDTTSQWRRLKWSQVTLLSPAGTMLVLIFMKTKSLSRSNAGADCSWQCRMVVMSCRDQRWVLWVNFKLLISGKTLSCGWAPAMHRTVFLQSARGRSCWPVNMNGMVA